MVGLHQTFNTLNKGGSMPNHTANYLKVTPAPGRQEAFAENLARLMEAVRADREDGEARAFSLDRIIPRPAELEAVHKGGITIDGQGVSRWLENDGVPEVIPEETLERWGREYGATDWYEWSCWNWGTKWDCYDVDPEWFTCETEASLVFHTAWSPPEPAMETLSGQFPNLMFDLAYDDEGGWFFGRSLFHDGDRLEEERLEYTEENRELLENLRRAWRLDPEDEDE